MRKVLVLGGNRYFGKRLVHLLFSAGDQVCVLNRGSNPDAFGERVTHLRADRTDLKAMKEVIEGRNWDVIYDQCCYSPRDAKLACTLFNGRVGRYIFTSTQSVYLGKGIVCKETDFNPFTEMYPTGFQEPFDYGEGKRHAESYFFQNAKFPVIALRIPIVLGTDDYSGRLQFHMDRIRTGRPLVIEDLAAEMSLMSPKMPRSFYFGSHTSIFQAPSMQHPMDILRSGTSWT